MCPGLPEVASGCLRVRGVGVLPLALRARQPPLVVIGCIVMAQMVLRSSLVSGAPVQRGHGPKVGQGHRCDDTVVPCGRS